MRKLVRCAFESLLVIAVIRFDYVTSENTTTNTRARNHSIDCRSRSVGLFIVLHILSGMSFTDVIYVTLRDDFVQVFLISVMFLTLLLTLCGHLRL